MKSRILRLTLTTAMLAATCATPIIANARDGGGSPGSGVATGAKDGGGSPGSGIVQAILVLLGSL
jgi:hypothetical protein